MANTIDTSLQRNVILTAAMQAFSKKLPLLTSFSTKFETTPLEGTDKVAVPFYPLDSSTIQDFSGDYVFDQDTVTDAREVTVNKRKYRPMQFSDAELVRQPKLDLERLGQRAGEHLAEQVLVDIMSLITNANFGAAAHTGLAAAFTHDEIMDIKQVCDLANWSEGNRSLLLTSAYVNNLLRDSKFTANAYGSDVPLRTGMIQDVSGFDIGWSNVIPSNSENLVGFAVDPSAILVAFAPVAAVGEQTMYDFVQSPETGLTIEFREWASPGGTKLNQVIEVNYGFALGNAAALKRVTIP